MISAVYTANGVRYIDEHVARGRRLYRQLAGEDFLCEICGRRHPLREHQECRNPTQPERA